MKSFFQYNWEIQELHAMKKMDLGIFLMPLLLVLKSFLNVLRRRLFRVKRLHGLTSIFGCKVERQSKNKMEKVIKYK